MLKSVAAIALVCPLEEKASGQCVSVDPNTVDCTGFDPDGFTISPPPPPGPDVTLQVSPGATVNGPFTIDGLSSLTFNNNGQINGNVTVTNNGDFSFDQNGTLGGTVISVTGSGSNELLVRSGRSLGFATLSGAQNRIENFGVLNNNVTLNAGTLNEVLNRPGAAVNQLTLNGQFNTIDNSGLFNQGLSFTNGHTSSNRPDNADNIVTNRSGGIINGINSVGGSYDTVDNSGTINGSINLGAGNDIYVNRAQTSGSVNLEDGNDVFAMVSGTMCCTVSLGNGNDLAFIFNGAISSDVQAGAGNDFLAWQGGTIVAGVRMGDGDDSALLSGLTSTNLTSGLPVDGGLGNDRLTWANTRNGTGQDVAQITYWESFQLTVNSELTFKNYSALTMGDPGTRTGSLSIGSNSTVLAGNGTHAVRPWDPSALVTVNNAGLIDLTNGPATASDQFVVYGNYVGQSGRLNLHTVLAGDDAPSDQLVIQKNSTAIDTPVASGLTTISVTNLNGPGAETNANGIRLVDAVGGAATTADAFVLNGRVAAGVFEYRLYRGGVAPDPATDSDWFLRSSAP